MARRTTTTPSIAAGGRKVFIETSGWFAVASEEDRQHIATVRYYRDLTDSGAALMTSDYVLDETLTRLRYDFGLTVSLIFWQRISQAQEAHLLTILRVDEMVWNDALDIFAHYADQDFSFTDCTSFVLCQRASVDEVFAFDHHFRLFGLVTQPVPSTCQIQTGCCEMATGNSRW